MKTLWFAVVAVVINSSHEYGMELVSESTNILSSDWLLWWFYYILLLLLLLFFFTVLSLCFHRYIAHIFCSCNSMHDAPPPRLSGGLWVVRFITCYIFAVRLSQLHAMWNAD